jgi:predicted transcriptional regulator
MKRVKVITSNAELEEFLARTDIEIINVDVRSCEQSWFAQEYFTAAIYYDDEPKSEYNPDYWTRLEHQYAGMAMQGILANSAFDDVSVADIAITSIKLATSLIKRLKEERK